MRHQLRLGPQIVAERRARVEEPEPEGDRDSEDEVVASPEADPGEELRGGDDEGAEGEPVPALPDEDRDGGGEAQQIKGSDAAGDDARWRGRARRQSVRP